MPDPKCKQCGGHGAIWADSTISVWKANYVLPGIDSSLTPPDQWRDRTCPCTEDDPPMRRGARRAHQKSKAKEQVFDNQMRDLFSEHT